MQQTTIDDTQYFQETHADQIKVRVVRVLPSGKRVEGPWCINENWLMRWWDRSAFARQIREMKS